MSIELVDLYYLTENSIDELLKCADDDAERFYTHVGELQALLWLLSDVAPKNDNLFALKRVLMILDRAGLYLDTPDSKVTMQIVLPYVQKTRKLLESAEGDHTDAH